MDASDARELVEDLSANTDSLESALKPLLEASVSANAANLPLIDKARLYTWTSYAIESLIFSYLNLNSIDGKTHPVFAELKRIQQYMHKIELAQNPDYGKRDNLSLDKAAVGRFIKAGLSGNDKYDKERAQKEAEQRAGAKRKLDALDTTDQEQIIATRKHEKQRNKEESDKSKKSEVKHSQSEIIENVLPGLPSNSSQSEQVTPRKKKSKSRSKRESNGKSGKT